MIFDLVEKYGEHEEILFCYNKDAHLKAIIAIHNTALGPALGGTRMWNYPSEEEALIDVLRLSKGMTYKAAVAGLNLGGGKAIIIGDPKKDKTERLFRAYGQYINSLNGRYITAEDVGTTVRDMEYVYMQTPWVTGISEDLGGSGDPSPYTARGVLMGIKACIQWALKTDSLKGIRVAVQGLGNVGKHLVEYLHKEEAEILVSDIDKDKVRRIVELYGVKAIDPEKILFSECDVIAPCALGSIVNDNSIEKFKASIIAGGANNVLAEERHGQLLKEQGFLYAPDYVINAGGLMNVFVELEGYTEARVLSHTKNIYDNLIKIFEISKKENVPTNKAADCLAERRIHEIGQLKRKHTGMTQRVWGTLKVDGR